MKKISLFLALAFLVTLLTGCGRGNALPEQKQYTATYLTLFDTVTTVTGRAPSEEAFWDSVLPLHDALLEYHQLFDIYNEYEGINNLKTINDAAGQAPVQVDERIIRLLLDCKEFYAATGGVVNIAMGSVLQLWHQARSDGLANPNHARLPEQDALTAAALHIDPNHIIIDQDASTVYLADPELRLDVGAIAKGWAVQQVCRNAPAGLLLSVGGNVCATGPKDESGTPWVVGIQDTDGSDNYLHTLYLTQGSVVTSGDYQRTYTVDGVPYHHIIAPDTLYPADRWRAVTVVCADSGTADALSTALFLLSQEEGQQLLTRYGAEAMWVDADQQIFYSPGFSTMIRT